MPSTQSRYQQGTVERVTRAKGPDVWIFRWRELDADGRRVQRKKIIGTVDQYKSKSAAQKAVENFRAQVNSELSRAGIMTIAQLWGHFEEHELRNPRSDRSPVTIEVYLDNFKHNIIPKWGEFTLDQVKAVGVEDWLGSLMTTPKKGSNQKPAPYAPASKSKLRNQMSCLYSHAIRHELWDKPNPITHVRQSSKRVKIPDILTLAEMQAIISGVTEPMHRIAILIAGVTGLRRSEIRGLKWSDVDFERLWLNLRRGIVRNLETKLKTEGSRRGVPIPEDLADELKAWRDQSPYRTDDDWVLASPAVGGRTPIWLDVVLRKYIHPVAKQAGITKTIGWHTFRRSLASILASKGENVKVVQELLRHSNASITQDLYQQADVDDKRDAQSHVKGLFVVKKAS